jgi:hypothetical protein
MSIAPQVLPTWSQLRAKLQSAAQEDGEWSGYPMLVHGIPLVMEPRYPKQVNGACLGEPMPGFESEDGEDTSGVRLINSWYSIAKHATVYVFEEPESPGQSRVALLPEWGGKRFNLAIYTLGASKAWELDAELRALETLAGHIGESRYKDYVLTGSFLETSPRSKVQYLFRKGRPTIALTHQGGMRILAVLCLHPIGFYRGTFAGAMVPTDDVIAHVLMMRGDEHLFWRKCNHHALWSAEAGV